MISPLSRGEGEVDAKEARYDLRLLRRAITLKFNIDPVLLDRFPAAVGRLLESDDERVRLEAAKTITAMVKVTNDAIKNDHDSEAIDHLLERQPVNTIDVDAAVKAIHRAYRSGENGESLAYDAGSD